MSSTSSTFPLSNLTATATYSVVVTNSNGCFDSSNTVTVTVNPLPETTLSVSPDVVCYGDASGLTATVSAGSTTAMSYTWYRGAAPMGSTTVAAYNLSSLTATTDYSVLISNSYGCLWTSNTVSLTVNPLPVTSISASPSPVCYGDASTLTARPTKGLTTAMSYTWYRETTPLETTEAETYNLSYLTATANYTVSVLNSNGCTYTSLPITITVNPLSVLTTVDINICSGYSFVLEAISSDSSDDLYWYGDPQYTQFITKASSFTMGGITNDTTFYVKAVNSYGCTTRGSLKVTVTFPPHVVAMEDQRVCYGDEITLTIYSGDGEITWNVPQTTFRHTATDYYIVTASRPPCLPASDTVRIMVGDSLYINPITLPDFQRNRLYKQQLQSNAEAPLLYILRSGQLPPGIMLHNDGSISGVCTFNQNDPTDYFFIIEILDGYGCSVYKNYSLHVDFFIPLVFSPNGDGINDYFMRDYRVIIYDRHGMKIFEGNDGWDGTCNGICSGKIAPDDVYFYVLFYPDEEGVITKITGSISLLR
jgi:gliding motility-associated-like protein